MIFKAYLRDTKRDRERLLSAKTKIRDTNSKLLKKKGKGMKDSSEKSKKQVDDEETGLHSHCHIFLTICDSIFQAFIAILRFLGFNHNGPPYRPTPSSPEDCYTAGSDPPSTAVDPPDDESVSPSFSLFFFFFY